MIFLSNIRLHVKHGICLQLFQKQVLRSTYKWHISVVFYDSNITKKRKSKQKNPKNVTCQHLTNFDSCYCISLFSVKMWSSVSLIHLTECTWGCWFETCRLFQSKKGNEPYSKNVNYFKEFVTESHVRNFFSLYKKWSYPL